MSVPAHCTHVCHNTQLLFLVFWSVPALQFSAGVPVSSMLVVSCPTDWLVVPTFSFFTMALLVLVASALMAGVKAEEDTAVATYREAIGETFMGALIIIGQCRCTALLYAKLHNGFIGLLICTSVPIFRCIFRSSVINASRITSNRSAGGTFALIHHHGFTCPFGVCLDGRGASRGRDRGCNLQRSYWRNLHWGPNHHRLLSEPQAGILTPLWIILISYHHHSPS